MMIRAWWMVAAAALVACGGGEDEAPSFGGTPAGGAGTGSGAGGSTAGSGGATTASSATSSGSGGTIDVTLGPDQCMAPPDGVSIGLEVGQQLPEIVLKDCAGNDYSLDEVCGAEATWIFAMHTWCPICRGVSDEIEAVHDGYAEAGLSTVLVVVADSSNQSPDAALCENVRQEDGHEDVITLFDPTGQLLALWNGSSSLSAFLDRDRVIRGKLTYTGDINTIEGEIDTALAAP